MDDCDADVIEQPRAVAAFELRRAVAGDLAAIAELELAAFTDPWSATEFVKFVDFRHGIFLVAVSTVGKELAGYTVITTVLDEAEVLNLAVAPSLRGIGVGGLLLDAGLSEAAARGASSVFLDVRESNAAARALYASRGFAEISRRRRYYARPVEDALVLRGAAQR